MLTFPIPNYPVFCVPETSKIPLSQTKKKYRVAIFFEPAFHELKYLNCLLIEQNKKCSKMLFLEQWLVEYRYILEWISEIPKRHIQDLHLIYIPNFNFLAQFMGKLCEEHRANQKNEKLTKTNHIFEAVMGCSEVGKSNPSNGISRTYTKSIHHISTSSFNLEGTYARR